MTLSELMVVVVIVGILLTIAAPRFGDLIRKANEGSTKGNLGALRSALTIYYADQERNYPTDDLTSLTVNAKYLPALPPAKTYIHASANGVVTISSNAAASLTDAGGWAYVNNNGSTDWGTVLVNCTHTDILGGLWTSY